MTPRALIVIGALALARTPAHAEPVGSSEPADAALARARDHFGRGEYAEAKVLLESAYASSHRADLLFALGQAEFNLGQFTEAMAYYEKFLATGPDRDRAALAQQAIGAARARIAAPPQPPAPRAPKLYERHRWAPEYTGLLVLGGVALVLGGSLLAHGHGLGDDESGTLTDYEQRQNRSRGEQITGVACAVGGLVSISAAVIAWRVRTETTVVAPKVSEHALGVEVGGTW